MNRKRSTLALAVCLSAAAFLTIPPAAMARQAPPRPLLKSTLGEKRAMRGSYCWLSGHHGVCVDAVDPLSRSGYLPVEPGRQIVIAMGHPTESLSVSSRSGRRLAATAGELRRHWRLQVPESANHVIGLHLFARYEAGDGSFGIHLRPQPTG
jgi:hypothetical protein